MIFILRRWIAVWHGGLVSTPATALQVELLGADVAANETLVEELVRIVNTAYAIGEAGIWLDGTTRTEPAEIADAIRNDGVLAATLDGRLVGCAYVRPLDATTADLGLLSAVPDRWGSGVGRELARFAEERIVRAA